MRYTHVGKIAEGQYTISSLVCPKCDGTLTIEITGNELFRINQGELNVLAPRLSPEERERFISGYCPTCWVALFGEDEECEEHEWAVENDKTICVWCEADYKPEEATDED